MQLSAPPTPVSVALSTASTYVPGSLACCLLVVKQFPPTAVGKLPSLARKAFRLMYPLRVHVVRGTRRDK